MSIEIKKYYTDNKTDWNNFIDSSKNGTFMLKRDYMEYHSDRFKDFSIMFYEKNNLIAVMPASIHGKEIISHGGLTYGGIISGLDMTTEKMLNIFESLLIYLKKQNIKNLIYKRVPHIYYTYPSDEDLYALFINNGKIIRRDISTSIYIDNKIGFSNRRKRNIKKSLQSKLEVVRSYDFEQYIELVNYVLNKYHNVKAVHSGFELKNLSKKFPNEIKLYIAKDSNNEMYAGVIIFDTKQTVHAQYIANSDKGRAVGALDIIFDFLINKYSIENKKKYFDFGISNENSGKFLNIGLIQQKQEFGGRGIIHDFYLLNI